MNNFKGALKIISKIFFTNRCEICGEVIELDRKVCDDCRKIEKIKQPICEFCGCNKDDCNCKKHKKEYRRIIAPYYYQDKITHAIHRFKNNDMPFLADKLGFDIADCVKENYKDIDFDVITFVPLRKLHQRKRGYNQAELLSSVVSKYINVPVEPLLLKVRYTGVQHHKSATKRKADVFGAYDINEEYEDFIKDKTILLIDDVKTTGSTLNECAKMLNIYGAKVVYCASVAITQHKKKKSLEI